MNKIKFSIRAKILLSFGIVIVLFLGTSVVNYSQFNEVKTLSQRAKPFSLILGRMQILSLSIHTLETDLDKFFVVGDEDYREKIVKDIEVIREDIVFEKEGLSQETLEDLDKFEREMTGLGKEVLELADWESENKTSRDRNEKIIGIYSKIDATNELIRKITQSTINDISMNVDEQNKIISNIISQSIVVSSIVLLFGILVASLLSRAISKPISELRNASIKIGGGDLNTRIKIESNDEIGQLASDFRQMTSDLKKSRGALEEESKNLERIVKKRTRELRAKMEDLEKINQFSMKREQRMIELKGEIAELEKELKDLREE